MKNIVLIGMMGAGKTSTGEILAKYYDKKFIDIDNIIEKDTEKSIIDIFKYSGEQEFRKIESETIRRYAEFEDQIISAGGGAVEDLENIEALQKNGILIYLKASPEELFRRCKKDSGNKRPLLENKNISEVLESLITKREKHYSMADITIMTDGQQPEEIAEKIIEILKEHE